MPAPTVEIVIGGATPMPAAVQWGLGGATGTANFQTINASLLVVCCTTDDPSNTVDRSITAITSAGLTFTRYNKILTTSSDPILYQEIWTAPLSGPISPQAISITIAAGADSAAAMVFGIVGAASFDAGGGTLPASAIWELSNPLEVTYDTTNADDLILYYGSHAFITDDGVPSGFTEIMALPGFSGARQVGSELGGLTPGAILTGVTTVSPIAGGSIGSMTVFAINDGSTTVPNVVGLTDSAATTAILAASLIVGTITPTPGGIPGVVFSQSPVAGTAVSGGSAVNLVEYEGVPVPNVVNTSLAVVAPGILAAAGLVVGVVTYEASGIIIAGNVIRQSPAAGSFLAAGSGVNLVVSTGLPSLRVPDIFGLSQADAIAAITSLGLVVGSISSAPSQFVPPSLVQLQNPSAGTPVAVGSVVSFILSIGIPAVGKLFDFEATVISQYANSPTILQLVQNMNLYVDQSTNFANFFNSVWDVDTAVGFGLDIWGKIVGVSRLLQIPNTTDYVGFDNGTRSPPDWQSMGSDQPPQPAVGGAMYTGFNATHTYLLGDDAYRQLILAKAFANIAATTAPALNTILQNLYGPGTAWVLNTGPMAISYNLNFKPSAIQLAILQQSGVIPTPPGVSVTIVVPP